MVDNTIFQVGDRVFGRKAHTRRPSGLHGTVLRLSSCLPKFSSQQMYLIAWDNWENGHSGGWEGPEGHCWWETIDCIELVKPVFLDAFSEQMMSLD